MRTGRTPGMSLRTATPATEVQHEDPHNTLDGKVLQKARVLVWPQRKLPHVPQLHQSCVRTDLSTERHLMPLLQNRELIMFMILNKNLNGS
jgi:hypothetical protein